MNNDVVADILTRALNGMRVHGWTRDKLIDSAGSYCAQGAVAHAMGFVPGTFRLLASWSPPFAKAMEMLDRSMELDDAALAYVRLTFGNSADADGCMGIDNERASGRVAVYNNSRASFADVEAWFIRAITLAQADDVVAEAEQLLATPITV